MEGKKIAFIVVAIAAVGGIAYYLNKRNKQLGGLTSEVTPETRGEKISKFKDTVKAQYVGHEVATPTYIASEENDGRPNRNIYA